MVKNETARNVVGAQIGALHRTRVRMTIQKRCVPYARFYRHAQIVNGDKQTENKTYPMKVREVLRSVPYIIRRK